VFEQVREVAAASHFQPLRQLFHRHSCLFSQAAGQRDFERVAFVPVGQLLLRAKQARAHRVQMHLIADGFKAAVAAAVNEERLVAAGEQVPENFMPGIEATRINTQKPLHAFDQVR